MDRPTPRSIRFTDTEIAELRAAGARIGIGWTTLTRRAALAAARRSIQPAMVQVGDDAVPLTSNMGK